ncbi:hypothetical protein DEDE109153_13370 [Deinococcus deserti]|uniref:Uncharacterized protein n=1 Tax=Deinococcus deserti (strain DSM 17065 / CIP 109153 / LMG 22923 / VCD115) TaxID=546414 RepID=C1CZ06_DEIDV|nr:hypothetical protein [Deinococcus deserti]ACO45044.1 hypothetical protein Deide_02350 [Deinococcus deserti VCD115]
MGEGNPRSTINPPVTLETDKASATSSRGANTNLDPNLQGGPTTAADQAATQEITHQDAQPGGMPEGILDQSDPARQMDNSGLLRPSAEGADAAIMGGSGHARNEHSD